MAQDKQQKAEPYIDPMRAYGLKDEPEHQEDPDRANDADEDESQEESDESAESASEDSEDDSLPDLKADKGDAGEEGPSDEEAAEQDKQEKKEKKTKAILDAEKRAEKAEEQMRKYQGESDRLRAQLSQQMERFWTELRAMKEGKNDLSTEGDIPDLPDDHMIDGKTLKGLIKGQAAKRQQEEAAMISQQQKINWVSSQPEIADVRKLIAEENWDNDPLVKSTPTDTVGLFFLGKSRLLEKKLKAQEQSTKEQIEKARAEERKKLINRKPLPPTGGHGDGTRAGSGKSLEPTNDLERRWLKFAKKVDPNARILRQDR